jgi:hypothetical protein
LIGRFRGGQAKIAIVSSSLFGNISGSAVANVVVDGAFTIAMMKKAGYPPALSAAVGLLIPIVHVGEYAKLTWASNGIGLGLSVLVLAMEWLARTTRGKTGAVAITLDSKTS